MLLDKATLLKPAMPRIERVNGENGDFVFVRALPMGNVDEYENENYVFNAESGKMSLNRRNYRSRLLVRAICDDKGIPLLTLKDIDAISKQSGKFWDDCYRAALRLNGLSGREDVERAEKNSDSAPGVDSALP